MTTVERIFDLLQKRNIEQKKFAEYLNIRQAAISEWKSGQSKSYNKYIDKIADYFDVSVDYLLGKTAIKEKPSQDWKDKLQVFPVESWYMAPIVGIVRAGYNGIAYENIIGYEPIYDVKNPEGCFWLRVEGDSMSPLIMEDDLVLVRPQSDVDSGSIAIVVFNGDEGTLKRVVKHANAITLASLNPDYEPRILFGEELQEVHILGEVIETKRKFKG